MNESARVLLIDDHEMARRGLRAMLSAADWIEVVGEGDSCESGLKLTDELEPDMVMQRILETNICRNLDSPVEVYIDHEGFYSILVYEKEKPCV